MKNQSRFKLFLGLLIAVAFNCLAGGAIAYAFGAPIWEGAVANNVIGVVIYQVRMTLAPDAPPISGIFMAGLNREVWLPKVIRTFRMDSRWLNRCSNLNAFVDNDAINLAAAGADPQVVYDYASSSGQIGFTPSTEDTPISLPLGSISTLEDMVDVNLQATRQYDIMDTKVERHIKTMQQAVLLKGAYGIAPAADGATSPVVAASGALNGGFRLASLADVVTLRQRFLTANMNNEEGVDEGKPVLVLTPAHAAAMQNEDRFLFKQFIEQAPGLPFDLYGFETYVSTAAPRYNAATGAKVAFNAAPAGTDTVASFAFLPGRAGRADGTLTMFLHNFNPSYQAHTFNFSKRFWVGNLNGTGIGAIYSPNS